MWIASLLLVAAQSSGLPIAASLEPETVAPYRPLELKIHGEAFEAGCRVLIGVPGRLVPVRSEVSPGHVVYCHVRG